MAASLWGVTAAAVTYVAADPADAIPKTHGGFWASLFVGLALVLLMFSMVRHLRRARENLGPAERAEHPGFAERPEPPRPRVDAEDAAPPDQSR